MPVAKFDIRHWGPSAWDFLHTATFAYPDAPCAADRNAAREFFTHLGAMLPCVHCRTHYQQWIRSNPVRTESREVLARWLVDAHNDVNRRTGKREVSFEEAKALYSPGEASGPSVCRSSPRRQSRVKLALAITVLALLMVLIAVTVAHCRNRGQ